MEITKGLLYINDKDAAQEWGVFLTEKKDENGLTMRLC